MATPVVISGQSKLFRDNQSFSGTIWAKADFRDPSGTQVRNSGLSRRFRDSWQLCTFLCRLWTDLAWELKLEGLSAFLSYFLLYFVRRFFWDSNFLEFSKLIDSC